MSDQPQGPGWWLASDGKWYSPDQAPAVPPPETWGAPPGGPPSPGMSSGAKVGLIVGASIVGLLVLMAVALVFLGTESTSRFESTGTAIGGDDAPPVDLPEGYRIAEGDGVSIGVPDGWEDISAEDFAMSAEELEKAFPDAPEELLEAGASAVDRGQVLAVFDTASVGFGDNVNVLVMGTRPPLDVIESQARTELGAAGADVGTIEEVDVPAGDALRAEYSFAVAGPAGNVDVVGAQYYVLTDDEGYVITFSGAGAVDLAEEMIETFRVR